MKIDFEETLDRLSIMDGSLWNSLRGSSEAHSFIDGVLTSVHSNVGNMCKDTCQIVPKPIGV